MKKTLILAVFYLCITSDSTLSALGSISIYLKQAAKNVSFSLVV